ncbi:hepcidin [Pleurodeles waltl]|uniref:hepcidin n=1 Tax=Pleurodeles waltl TaxID=8319 RepID=UPI003709B2F4
MKLLAACLVCSLLCLSASAGGTRSISGTQRDSVDHSVSLSEPALEEPSLLMSLLRTKRQSHLSLCSFCCNCCKNKGCGYCCRT